MTLVHQLPKGKQYSNYFLFIGNILYRVYKVYIIDIMLIYIRPSYLCLLRHYRQTVKLYATLFEIKIIRKGCFKHKHNSKGFVWKSARQALEFPCAIELVC